MPIPTKGLQTELYAASSPAACRVQRHSEAGASPITHDWAQGSLQGRQNGK